MKKTFSLLLLTLGLWVGSTLPPARAVTLEQIISRENPEYNNAGSTLSVGRDGVVYLLGRNKGYNGLILRVARDGSNKVSGDSGGPAYANVAANAQGIVATPQQHFTHSVRFFDKNLVNTGANSDFVSTTPEFGENGGYDEPTHAESGASGDFYALAHLQDRIVRLAADGSGKAIKNYMIPREGAGPNTYFLSFDFRVDEKREVFWTWGRTGNVRNIGFDGAERWKTKADFSGGWDVDENGVLFSVNAQSDTVQKLDAGGKPAGEVKLAWNDPKTLAQFPITGLEVWNGEIFVKRRHPTEMFARFDAATGAFKNAPQMDFERLAVTFPDEVWTAGQSQPFAIEYSDPVRGAKPQWHVWGRTLGALDYRELKIVGGKLQVPADWAGLHQIKVTPELRGHQRGAASEYLVSGWVEVRKPQSVGTLNVWTPDNRVYFGRGETIPFSISRRVAPGTNTPARASVQLKDGARIVAQGEASFTDDKPLQWVLSPNLTGALRPGQYRLEASAAGLTSVPQILTIGAGANRSPFMLMQYGDYGGTYPWTGVTDAPDYAAAWAARKAKLGFNLMVDPVGFGTQLAALSFPNAQATNDVLALAKKLGENPSGVAPEKAATSTAFQQTMGLYSASGISHMSILLANDAGLPLGSGYDSRKPEQLALAITNVTQALSPYAAFRGWVWASNAWTFDKGAAAIGTSPEQKETYAAALKKARESGVWDPLLETVADRWLAYAPDAQKQFNAVLKPLAPRAVTAWAGPNRNMFAWPPTTFANVDEVDLQAQWEQVEVPFHAPHGVDFYKRPGKPAWGHPEVWNDDGSGGQILPTLFEMTMRGATGVGVSGNVPMWGAQPEDARLASTGLPSIVRSLNTTLRQYGPWLTTLQNDDRVAIVASKRQFVIDQWPNTLPHHYGRVFEAYFSLLHAHQPASIVFSDDVTPDTFKKYKAVIVVGQTVEMEPKVMVALKAAQGAGTTVFADGTSRAELVKNFKPLGVSFNKLEADSAQAADDSAFFRFQRYAREHLPALHRALDKVAPRAAQVANEQILVSRRKGEAGTFIFVVNHVKPDLEPGKLWRINQFSTSLLPIQTDVGLGADAKIVYDVFAMRRVTPKNGVVSADLRALPMRLYAILPQAISGVALRGPARVGAGEAFAWNVKVQDASGAAIRASVPLRLRLLAKDNTVLEERFVGAGSTGASGRIRAPLNAAAGVQTLEATELFSGQSARLSIVVAPPAAPAVIAARPSAASAKAAAATASATASKTSPASPSEKLFGAHLRDIAVSQDGSTAVFNAMNWGDNLYGIDLKSGAVKWHQKIGDYYAFAPQSAQGGGGSVVAVQGFDFESAEGYHLHLVGADGKTQRRFALPGLPARAIHRFVPYILHDRINNFALAPDASWVAGAGDLGIAVWDRAGKQLWSRADWKTNRNALRYSSTANFQGTVPQSPMLAALDAQTLLVADAMKIAALRASSGKQIWSLDLATSGTVAKIAVSGDGKTIALLSSTEGGRVYIVRDGKLAHMIPSGGIDMALSPDGSRVALLAGSQLKMYRGAGLQWLFSGDDTLRFPRFSPDGARLVVTSEIGTTSVFDASGKILHERDNGAIAVPAWIGNDLLLASWMGKVSRLDAQYKELWSASIQPSLSSKAAAETPTSRLTGWTNAQAKTPPNLVTQAGLKPTTKAFGAAGWEYPLNNAALLFDGKPDAPAEPWLSWTNISWMAETTLFNSLGIDLDKPARLTGITLVEDATHPESWLRDVALQSWDAKAEKWVFVQTLLSDSATHTHMFKQPVETSRLRLVMPFGMPGSSRLGEIQLHGEVIG